VTTVPAIDPAVAMPESRPTTVPVSSRLVSCSLVTIGVIAESSAPGTTMVTIAAGTTRVPAPVSAPPRTSSGVSATTTPEMPSSGPRVRRGGTRSAARPPAHEPSAIAESASPMTRVLVSSVRPRYGASSRSATSSTTSTAAEDPKTRATAPFSFTAARPCCPLSRCGRSPAGRG